LLLPVLVYGTLYDIVNIIAIINVLLFQERALNLLGGSFGSGSGRGSTHLKPTTL